MSVYCRAPEPGAPGGICGCDYPCGNPQHLRWPPIDLTEDDGQEEPW